MAHPQMFDDDDPLLARVREIALALPGAAMKVSHGRPAFFTQKVFAYVGGSERIDGEWVRHDHCVLVLPDADERAALLDDERVYVPAYLGPSGWIGIELPRTKVKGWDEIAELVESSYRTTAPRARVAELDARG